jgi:DNA-binding CsgD family transcriptional regulator
VLATRIQRRMLAFTESERLRAAALDAMPFAAIVLDERGRILESNRSAELLLRSGRGLKALGRRLSTCDPGAAQEVGAAIERACLFRSASSPATATLLRCRRTPPARPLQLLVAPIAPRHGAELLGFTPRRAAALVIAADPDAAPMPAADALRQLFGLTPALSRLAAALAAGKSIADYAEEARVSEGTARNQLKALFARTGTQRQAELVRLLLSGVAQLDAQWIERAGDD